MLLSTCYLLVRTALGPRDKNTAKFVLRRCGRVSAHSHSNHVRTHLHGTDGFSGGSQKRDVERIEGLDEWLLARTRGEMIQLAILIALTVESLVFFFMSLFPELSPL